jgi:inositol 1,4,5-triphosphate receptor type 1/inositol 1,4,5-triphosphate receptor type 3
MFDNFYNLLLMIIMLNIIAGIIIDTFASLRDKHEADIADKKNICFICGLNKDLIERATNKPFAHHTYFDHNEWNYLFFL